MPNLDQRRRIRISEYDHELTRKMTETELAIFGKHRKWWFRDRWMTEDAIQCWLSYWPRFPRGD
jgi:hypothetical protein